MPSLDDDRAQDTPVRLAGVEKGTDPVVPENPRSATPFVDEAWLAVAPPACRPAPCGASTEGAMLKSYNRHAAGRSVRCWLWMPCEYDMETMKPSLITTLVKVLSATGPSKVEPDCLHTPPNRRQDGAQHDECVRVAMANYVGRFGDISEGWEGEGGRVATAEWLD